MIIVLIMAGCGNSSLLSWLLPESSSEKLDSPEFLAISNKRGYIGIYYHMSEKHLHRNVREFTGRHNIG